MPEHFVDSSQTAEILDLIGMIYDAVADSSRWQTFLKRLAETFHCDRANFLLAGAREWSIACVHGWTYEELVHWKNHHWATDPWKIAAEKTPVGVVLTSLELCSMELLEQSSAFREFYGPRNCIYGIGGNFLRSENGISLISLVRGREFGPCGDREKARLEPLMPHLRRAALLHTQLASMRVQLSTFTSHLDRYPHAFVLIDAECRILYANAPARETAGLSDSFTIKTDRVLLPPQHQKELEKAVREVAAWGPRASHHLVVERKSGKAPYRLLIFGVTQSQAMPLGVSQPAAAILILHSESDFTVDPVILRQLYALTPAECRITEKLVVGLSVEETATAMNTSLNTVRTHVKHILSKTSTTRQGELISVVLRTVPFQSKPE